MRMYLQAYSLAFVYMQVQCDKCDSWQHVDCIDMQETSRHQNEYNNKPFFCLTCADDDAPSFIH